MARPLQVLRLLPRLGALSVKTTSSCRFASRGAGESWTGQSHVRRDRASNRAETYSDDEDCELEDVESKLQALVDDERKRQKTVKYHILRRQMTPPGAPQRKLTWDAIEQIRYLKQEQPEEWTVERLAEGFSVTPDTILRVLRSKFVPLPDRKSKQDAKVMAVLGQDVLPSGRPGQDRLKLPVNRTPPALSSGGREPALISVAEQTLMIQGEGSGSPAKTPATVTVVPTTAGVSQTATVTRSPEKENTNPPEEDTEDDGSWDGQVLTEEELEECMEMQKAHPPVAQVGNEFFDTDGNFLYRI